MWDFKQYNNNIAFIDEDGRKIRYDEIEEKARMYICLMESKRNLVLLVSDNSMESVMIYVACIQNRIPLMLVDNNVSKEALDRLLGLYCPNYIWYFGSNNVFDEYKLIKVFHNYQFYKRCNSLLKRNKIDKELALLILTSGSIGGKKSVRISYQNIEANMNSIAKSLCLSENDTAMLMLPISYCYGLSVVNSNLSVGATILIPKSRFFERKFWLFFKNHNCSAICGVPYTYEVLKKMKFHRKTLPSLRLITQAGGALGQNEQRYLLEYALEHKINLAIMYGQTEATARISTFFLNQHIEKLGSVGKVIPNGEIYIDYKNDTGVGEIIYVGKNVTQGYAESYRDLAKGDENNGILHTGDLGYIDSDGYLFIVGRIKRFSKIQGKRISLDELQQIISLKSGIVVYCIEKRGKIYVFLEGAGCTDTILDAMEEIHISRQFFEVIQLHKFPRESNEKISYRALLENI